VDKTLVRVSLPPEEHHQTSDLEALLAAVGRRPEDCSHEVLKTLPQALRGHEGEATVASFGRRILSVEAGEHPPPPPPPPPAPGGTHACGAGGVLPAHLPLGGEGPPPPPPGGGGGGGGVVFAPRLHGE